MGRKKGIDVREGTNVPNVLEAKDSHIYNCAPAPGLITAYIYTVSLKACGFTDSARDSNRLTSK